MTALHQTESRPRWTLRAGGKELHVGPAPVIMGILNVTPDSFSDGGEFRDADAAIARGIAMAEAGAEIVDVGGESTRPGAADVPPDEEIERVVPVIKELARRSDAVISIDTRKAEVAEAALDAGAALVNDVSSLGDPDMKGLVARAGCPLVLMHMKGTPATMQQAPAYQDVVAEVRDFLQGRIDAAAEAGIDPGQTIVDPGIGFGKTLVHNLELLRRLGALRDLGRPILVGTSRKSFIGKILHTEVDKRLMGTVASCVWARARGADIFRVHDVRQVREALTVIAAIENPSEC